MLGTGELVVALSGQAGSGKSTLATHLAGRLNGDVASFGNFVRHLAEIQGASPGRRSLQEIGEAAVRAGAKAFVADFIAWADPAPERTLIVDGIRHIAVEDAMRAWAATAGRRYVAVAVTASEALRADRRTMGDQAALRLIDSHPVEQESATALPLQADIVVEENWDGDAVLQSILRAARP